jgi:hypothetical protein
MNSEVSNIVVSVGRGRGAGNIGQQTSGANTGVGDCMIECLLVCSSACLLTCLSECFLDRLFTCLLAFMIVCFSADMIARALA